MSSPPDYPTPQDILTPPLYVPQHGVPTPYSDTPSDTTFSDAPSESTLSGEAPSTPDPPSTPVYNDIFDSIDHGDVEGMEKFLIKGGDPNQVNEEGASLLVIATGKDSLEMVQCLIGKWNANVDFQDRDGNTALHFAFHDWFTATKWPFCSSPLGYKKIIRYLVEKQANVNSHNGYCTPFHLAIHYNRPDLVELFLDYGADQSVRVEGKTALQYAVDQNKLNVVKLLVKTGGDLNEDNGHVYQIALENFEQYNGGSRPNPYAPMVKYLQSMKEARQCHSLVSFLIEETELFTTHTAKNKKRSLHHPLCTTTSLIDPRTCLYTANPYTHHSKTRSDAKGLHSQSSR